MNKKQIKKTVTTELQIGVNNKNSKDEEIYTLAVL